MLKLLVVSLALASSSPPATAGKTQDTSKTEPTEALVVDERRRLSPSQIQKLTASDAAVADQFGHSVGISRDWLIVGAPYAVSPSQQGKAYLFGQSGGSWAQIAIWTAPDGATGDNFGISVAITAGSAGSFAVVGAVNDDDHGALSSGSAYVWKKRLPLASSTVWEYVDKLTAGAADAAQEAYFGWSVGISSESGGNAVAGAWGTNGVGAAFIFEYDASTFSLVNKLVANDAAPNDQFGRAVAIDGAEALIGAPNKACSTTGVCGAAYIFEQVQMGGSKMWAEVQKLIPDDAAEGDTFGGSVAISASAGGWAVVGAPGKTGVRLYSGAAYVFRRKTTGANMGLWEQVYKLTANDAWQADNFGWSVATDGTFAAAGALYDDDGGTNSGSAYVFERKSKKDWPQIAKLVANDHDALDNFGISVGLSRGHAVVGSPQDDDLALSTGSAYLFDLHAPLTCADDPACMGCLTKNIGTGAITCMGLWSPRRCQHSNKLNKRTTYCPDDLCLAASCPSNTCAAKKANGAKKCKAWSQVRCGNMKGQAPHAWLLWVDTKYCP